MPATHEPTSDIKATGGSAVAVQGWALDQQRRGLMPSTIYRRATMVRGWLRWCEHYGLDWRTADPESVQRFLDGRRCRGSAIGSRTRYTWLSCLGCFYSWAVRDGLATTNPTAEIMRPKLRQTLPRPIGDDDLAHAIAHAPPMIRVWLMLAAYGGLRVSEIAGLQRDDLMADRGLLRVCGKGGKERVVPVHAELAEALNDWPTPKANRHLFVRPEGGAWTGARISAAGNTYLRDVGVDATMHQLRHWFGTRMLAACKNLRTVQQTMGHSSPVTTAIYTAFCNEDARAAVDAIQPAAAQRSLFA